MMLSTAEIRDLDRSRKSSLVGEIESWARRNGRRWAIGGPSQWSRDELVAAVVRIRTGQEP